ncbi:MAG: 1,4-dihydroxy-2-naphthoate polyprenyltransferase [Acidimicrobiales bacterium]
MSSPSGTRLWVAGARPRTLPAALVPVAVGAGCATGVPGVAWWRVILAAVVSLSLQVGVNYANDYSDGVRGTDTERVGPLRLVGSGLVEPSRVKRAAAMSLLLACLAGAVLALVTTLWLVVVGLAAVLAAWFYTGGPRPYGYAGLGELFVFVFFGLVATVGTTYVLCTALPARSWWAGSAAGCLSCALLVVNNLRDIPGDTVSGKRTLAVRLGDRRTRVLFIVLFAATAAFVAATAVVTGPSTMLGLLGVLAAAPAIRGVLGGARGPALIAVLGAVGRAQLVFGATCAVGIALSLA